jgi:pimeloyl-ACP methyl ester carboxylesterase
MTIGRFVDAVLEEHERHGMHEVVLVGHSLGGVTLPAVAQALGAHAVHAVYIAAIVAAPGQTPLQAVYGDRAGRAMGWAFDRGPERTAGPRRLSGRRYFSDIPPSDREPLLDRLVPEWMSIMNERVPVPAIVVATPSTYVRTARDKQLAPKRQAQMVQRLGPSHRVVELDSGHDPMLSRPEELARIINAVAVRPAQP